MIGLIVVYLGQCLAQWKAFYCRCNRYLCIPRRDDYSVERRVVRVDLRIVGPGIRMRKYLVNFIVANAESFRVRGIDVLAETEWRLRRFVLYPRVRICIEVRKGTNVGGTSVVTDESSELARMVNLAGWIAVVPARSIHTIFGAVGIRVTTLAV